MTTPRGYLALVLHAHLPFVRHPEYQDFLEERWFFEALNETYLPLLQVLEQLEDDGVDYHLLLSISPPLLSMMEDELLQERYKQHLWKILDLIGQERLRTGKEPELNYLVRYYENIFTRHLNCFEHKYQNRPALAFAKIAAQGHLELMTSSATHGFLPLLQNDPGAVQAQIGVGLDLYQDIFDIPSAGIWLPECAYYPGLDEVLKTAGIRFFITDSHGLENGTPRPRHGVYEPVYCPGGVAAFARDQRSSKQVWSAEEGFPGDPDYREFYRDLGHDHELDDTYLRDFMVDGKIRTDTGIKYYRITGSEQKQLYNPVAAREKAAVHAGIFLEERQKQVRELSFKMDRPPVIVSPYDAELFGHWWFEGPSFLDILLRKIHYDQDFLKTITPAIYLKSYPVNQVSTPAASSWGADGNFEFWCTEANNWLYPHLHEAALNMQKMLVCHLEAPPQGLAGRCLRQAGRELLLAQSSDWPFIMRTGTSPDYATKRVKDHLGRLQTLTAMLENGKVDERVLLALEQVDNIFPNIDMHKFKDSSALSF